MSASHHGTWDGAGHLPAAQRWADLHTPLPTITLLVGACRTVWKQLSCLCYGPSAWEEEEERQRLYGPEKCAIVFLKLTSLCHGVIRCLTGLQEMGRFGVGTVF